MKNISKINYFKLFLLGLITPLLYGVSFGLELSQSDITYLNKVAYSSGSFSSVPKYELANVSSIANDTSMCVLFNDLYITKNGNDANLSDAFFVGTVNSLDNNYARPMYWGYNHNFNMFCFSAVGSYMYIAGGSTTLSFSSSQFWVVYTDDIINGNMGIDVDGLVSSLQSCESNLNTCDTTVQQCLIDKESLSGSLASCNSDKSSLQNYNNSLTEQLNQCLNDNLSGDYISGSFLRYSMFWQDNDTMFSLPITNDLFLPNGYKGKLDEDNVLSIAKLNILESAYQFSDEDKITIIDLLSMVMLFLLATGSLIGIILFLKRLIIKK